MKPVVAAIAGPSCAGKTGLARRLCSLLGDHGPVLFPLDGYYRDLSRLSPGEVRRHNFDSPYSLDVPLLTGHLHALARGEAVDRPIYEYASHRRVGTEKLSPGGLLLVEGLFALFWEEFLPLYDLGVFMDLDDGACLARRLARDERERGADRAFTRWQWEAHVRPMADRFVRPTRSRAALVLDGGAPLEENAVRAAEALRDLLAEQGTI